MHQNGDRIRLRYHRRHGATMNVIFREGGGDVKGTDRSILEGLTFLPSLQPE